MWLALEDRELSSCDGRGLGVCPCMFFNDNVRAVSAMEGSVQVRGVVSWAQCDIATPADMEHEHWGCCEYIC